MRAQLSHAGIERSNGPGGARLHDSTFHDRQHERRTFVRLWNAGGFEARFYGLPPRSEISIDERVGRGIFRIDLERQPANRAPIPAIGVQESLAIALQQGKNADNRQNALGQQIHVGVRLARGELPVGTSWWKTEDTEYYERPMRLARL